MSVFEFDDWWEVARTRLEHLDTVGIRVRNKSFASLSNETTLLRVYAAWHLIKKYTRQWQKQHNVGAWRLPPDGFLGQQIKKTFPEIRLDILRPSVINPGTLLDFAHTGEQWADFEARLQFEKEHPAPDGFQPITRHRSDDETLLLKLQEQERHNLPYFPYYRQALHDLKHHKSTAGVSAIFTDPRIDVSLPPDILVWHQIQVLGYSFRDQWANDIEQKLAWSFEAHMSLREGNIVRYDHIRSSTIKAWWFGTLGGNLMRPLSTALPDQETAVLLELIPRSGIFISDASNETLNTHLGSERELILPAHTYWQVVGIRDIAFDDSRLKGRPEIKRVRGVQMVEINHPPAGEPIQIMTNQKFQP